LKRHKVLLKDQTFGAFAHCTGAHVAGTRSDYVKGLETATIVEYQHGEARVDHFEIQHMVAAQRVWFQRKFHDADDHVGLATGGAGAADEFENSDADAFGAAQPAALGDLSLRWQQEARRWVHHCFDHIPAVHRAFHLRLFEDEAPVVPLVVHSREEWSRGTRWGRMPLSNLP
jgi:hypothetical protein